METENNQNLQQNNTPPTNNNVRYWVVGVFLVLAAALVVAYFSQSKKTAVQNSGIYTATNQPNLDFTPSFKENLVPLSEVSNFQAVKAKYGLNLSAGQEKFLDDNKFLLIEESGTNFQPGFNFNDMLQNFEKLGGSSVQSERKPEDAKLITPDIMLEAYHKYFELTLKELEKNELSTYLQTFLEGLTSNLQRDLNNANGDLKVRYQNLLAQTIVSRAILENKSGARPDYFQTPDEETEYIENDKTIDSATNAKNIASKYNGSLSQELKDAVNQELDSVYKSSEVGVSPLFKQYNDELSTDYTQFTPRSHYTESSLFRAYFRTMMYLGRSSYFFKKDVGIIDTNLMAREFSQKAPNGSTPEDVWNKIMNITGFYAGVSDDLTYTQWKEYLAATLGKNNPTEAELIAPDTITKLKDNLDKLPKPKILSDVIVDENISNLTKQDLLNGVLGFRVFGQRFTFDAWVLNDLTAGQEKTDTKLPSTPSALFVNAAFGDERAKMHAEEFLKQNGFSSSEINGFNKKLEAKKTDISKVSVTEWFKSLGSGWLYLLGSLTNDFGEGYPQYMRSIPFLDKQIQSFLGSYAELKHDTLLYAKQSYAELGGGGDDASVPPVVRGFVEPNLKFWERFNSLIESTHKLFQDNQIFTDNSALSRLEEFQKISKFYQGIAVKELKNESITEDEYEQLRTSSLYFMARPFTSEDATEETGKVALIADIHTDSVKGQILYEATAKPYLMLALVGDAGQPRVVAGLVYNHYEFTNPLTKRLTDEDWKAWVYKETEKLPSKNFWYQSLIAK